MNSGTDGLGMEAGSVGSSLGVGVGVGDGVGVGVGEGLFWVWLVGYIVARACDENCSYYCYEEC